MARATLADISSYPTYELQRIGWTDNPLVKVLYSLTSAGVWISNRDDKGQNKTIEGNSLNIQRELYGVYPPTIEANAGNMIDSNSSTKGIRRIITIESALIGGALADVAILPALAGYYGVIEVIGIISDTNIGALTLTFQDEDDAALTGLNGGSVELNLTANVMNEQIKGAVLYKGDDTKALEVDYSGAAGVEKVTLQCVGWYET